MIAGTTDGSRTQEYMGTSLTGVIVSSSEEVGAVTPAEEEPESEKVASPECSSNTFIGQKQADGSWKTVCKE